MKTPDEIKKGLENAFTIYNSASSYFLSETFQKVTANIAKESLSYIQQLETKCHQLERERDAAVEACGKFPCESCVESENGDNCNWCAVVNGRRTGYVWRGVKENA